MRYYKNNIEMDKAESFYRGKDLIISIDSSKTDTGMFVADSHGNILDDYDFCGDASDNVLDQCFWERRFLKVLFDGANIKLVGIEDIITKKSRGIEEHMSRFKITAIFMSFISYFQDVHGYTPVLVNNWEWKSDILPEKYRTRDYDKGSQSYLISINSPYGRRNDNITDAYCILQHLIKKYKISSYSDILNPETCIKNYSISIAPVDYAVGVVMRFNCNKEFSLKINTDVICNHLAPFARGVMEVDINYLSIEEIYKYSIPGIFKYENRRVNVIVQRRE